MKIVFAGQHFTMIDDKATEVPFPLQIVKSHEPPSVPEECISLRDNETPDIIAHYMAETGVWNAVYGDPQYLGVRLSTSVRLIQNPKNFFEKPAREILTPSFKSPEAVAERRWKFRSTSDKRYVMKMLERYVQNVPGARGVLGSITAIADEMFTNALFNAPFGDSDSTLDRATLVVLNPELAAELIVGHTDDHIFLGCIDVFGTLSCDNLLRRIYKGFDSGIAQSLNMDKGGAGIGILRIVDLSPDIFVVVEKEKKTLIGCSFALKRSSRRTREAAKSFHFQFFQNVEGPNGTIRVERRGKHALFRVFGKIDSTFPFGNLEISGLEEATVDMRLSDLDAHQALQDLIPLFRSVPTIRKIYLEYVPHPVLVAEFLSAESRTAKGTAGDFEVRSLSVPFHCDHCKSTRGIFFAKVTESKDAPAPMCPKCGRNLKPQSGIEVSAQ